MPITKIRVGRCGTGTNQYTNPWAEDEVNILRENYSTASRELMLELLPKRGWEEIKSKARKLGIPRRLPHKIRDMSDLERGRISGIVDADGTIGLTRNKNPHKYRLGFRLNPNVHISNTYLPLLQYCRDIVGLGYVVADNSKSRRKHKNWSQAYIYFITGMNEILSFLRVIEPSLVAKRERAKLMITFLESRLLRKGRKRPYTDRELEIYERLKELNQLYGKARRDKTAYN